MPGGGAGEERRQAGSTGVLQGGEGATDRALVGERRKRQQQRLTHRNAGVRSQEALSGT